VFFLSYKRLSTLSETVTEAKYWLDFFIPKTICAFTLNVQIACAHEETVINRVRDNQTCAAIVRASAEEQRIQKRSAPDQIDQAAHS
jgi:hypothetical protein